MSIPGLKMNSGTEVPQIGLGLWLNKDEKECKDAVRFALEAGYTHFDSAQAYQNEEFLGAAIAESEIPRESLFITTKIWNGNQPKDKLQPSFEESLKKLGTDYVDLLLLHFPVSETRHEAWPLMEEIYASGKARAVGVSNYTIRHLEELLKDCKTKPAVNQVELHVFLQQPELVEYCKQHDILVEAYSPLVHGHNMDDPTLEAIAKKYGKTVAQIMIRWCIELGTVPLPKSTHKERIEENIDVFDFKLDNDDMAKIAKLDENYRTAWDPSDVA
jgi:diketogulonate reductase-like aldo/keto reductase